MLTISTFAMVLAAASPSPPPKLGLCASCHGANGIAVLPAHPHLAGQDEAYLRAALAAYRNGARQHAPMQAAVGVLSEAELDALARYFASLPRDGGEPR